MDKTDLLKLLDAIKLSNLRYVILPYGLTLNIDETLWLKRGLVLTLSNKPEDQIEGTLDIVNFIHFIDTDSMIQFKLEEALLLYV